MKTCMGCKHAQWKKTSNGRLHPSGDGQCLFEYKIPPLPASRYIVGGMPIVSGGSIERKGAYKDHCPYYSGTPQGQIQIGTKNG